MPEGIFFIVKSREKIFSGSSRPLNFRRKQQEKTLWPQGTYLAPWISQVQNTAYELPSITFLERSLINLEFPETKEI